MVSFMPNSVTCRRTGFKLRLYVFTHIVPSYTEHIMSVKGRTSLKIQYLVQKLKRETAF